MGSYNPVPLTWEPAPYFCYQERMSFVSVQTDATYCQIETIWKGYSILSKLIPKKQGQPGNCKWGKTRNSLQRDGSFQNFLGTELKICFQSSPDHVECYVTSAIQCLLYRLPHNHLRQLLPSSPLQSWANWNPERLSHPPPKGEPQDHISHL